MNYTGSVTKQYTAYDWYRTLGGERGTELAQERQPAAQPEGHLQLDDPGTRAGSWATTSSPRACSTAGSCRASRRFLGGTWSNFTYNFSGAAPNATTLTGGLGGSRVDHRVRSEPAAERADVRSPVPHRVRRGRPGRSPTRPTRSIRAPGLAPARKMPAWAWATSTTT